MTIVEIEHHAVGCGLAPAAAGADGGRTEHRGPGAHRVST
jgi:hypothetical protein